MAAKGTKVSQKEKEKMWKLYQELRTYTAVARKMRRSPDTVSRYVHEYETAVSVAGYIINSESV